MTRLDLGETTLALPVVGKMVARAEKRRDRYGEPVILTFTDGTSLTISGEWYNDGTSGTDWELAHPADGRSDD